MRIATYNFEWFDALFDRDANPRINLMVQIRFMRVKAITFCILHRVILPLAVVAKMNLTFTSVNFHQANPFR